MTRTSFVQDAGNLGDRRVSPVGVGLGHATSKKRGENQEASKDHGLIVGNVELIRYAKGSETGTERHPRRL